MENFTTTDGTNSSINYGDFYTPSDLNRLQYEEDLKKRQINHLNNIQRQQNTNWRPCLHDSCTECHGTGVRRDGGMCLHGISCPCPKCTTSY